MLTAAYNPLHNADADTKFAGDLVDAKLKIVMSAARTLPVEKRDLYLQHIAAMLAVRGRGHFGDADVADVVRLALTGLAHQPAA